MWLYKASCFLLSGSWKLIYKAPLWRSGFEEKKRTENPIPQYWFNSVLLDDRGRFFLLQRNGQGVLYSVSTVVSFWIDYLCKIRPLDRFRLVHNALQNMMTFTENKNSFYIILPVLNLYISHFKALIIYVCFSVGLTITLKRKFRLFSSYCMWLAETERINICLRLNPEFMTEARF